MAAFVEANWASSASKKGGWEEVEDSKLMLDLMLSSVDRSMPGSTSPGDLQTLDLLGAAAHNQLDMNVDCCPSPPLTPDALDLEAPLPPGWQKCLDLQTGRVYYLQNNGNSCTKKSSNLFNTRLLSSSIDAPRHSPSTETDLKQAIAMASKRARRPEGDGDAYQATTNVSVFGVDLSSPPLPKNGSSPKHATENENAVLDMTTVGCANCLMFVMLSITEPRCPNCGSCAVLDFSQPVTKRAKQE